MIEIRDFDLRDFAAVAIMHPEHVALLEEIQEAGWFEDSQTIWSRTLVDAAGQVAAIGGGVPDEGGDSLTIWALVTDVGRKHPLGLTRRAKELLELVEYVHQPRYISANAQKSTNLDWLRVLGFRDDPTAARRLY
jgi:hypothetical protein